MKLAYIYTFLIEYNKNNKLYKCIKHYISNKYIKDINNVFKIIIYKFILNNPDCIIKNIYLCK